MFVYFFPDQKEDYREKLQKEKMQSIFFTRKITIYTGPPPIKIKKWGK